MNIEDIIGYTFQTPALLRQALTHRSYRFEEHAIEEDNQRLEFLGDAVLDLIAAERLYTLRPEAREGELSKMRSRCTRDQALAEIGNEHQLGECLRLGIGEEQSGGRIRPSNIADMIEAILGAAYLDGGLPAAQQIFNTLFTLDDDWMSENLMHSNPKGQLLEYCQKHYDTQPEYTLVTESGPPHRKTFTVNVSIETGQTAQATAESKRKAEAQAARKLLNEIQPLSS